MLVCPEAAVRETLDLPALVPAVEDALVRQARGEVERPERPHFPVGQGLEGEAPLGMGIAMPAYVHGAERYATKLVGVHEANPDRGLPTVNAVVALTDARTGLPEALLAGNALTNARTACIGALAVRAFAPDAATLGVIGAGAQARWQTRAAATVADLEDVRVYSPNTRAACAADLRGEGVPARAVESARAAVEGADAVVTATTATEPVFPPEALAPGALVVAVGAYTAETQELDPAVLEQAETVLADVPGEVAETGDLLATDLGVGDLAEFGAWLDGDRDPPAGRVVVDSVGSAVLDAAAGAFVYERAQEAGLGTDIGLWE
ncbi:ornithine cyclodeaminase family protein [Salinirussus salinus]|uniref:ornithine cyclodeaminase family protein n=1 Tax=Salinirussus salinus TaxID=1198300 RepID=UPI00135A558F|nr:ornithine cyclodeaminase family protein [Salinirussus salinus]